MRTWLTRCSCLALPGASSWEGSRAWAHGARPVWGRGTAIGVRIVARGGQPVRIAEVTPLVMGATWRNLTFVRVRTDEGLVGVGEGRMVNQTRALLGYLEHAIPTHPLGSDPF